MQGTKSTQNPVLDIPRCSTCSYFESKGINKGYCNLLSNSGERKESIKQGAASYDDFWTTPEFYCAKHSDQITGS